MHYYKFKVGFDIWALILFILIMIPNFIWFSIPAPNDILKTESITPLIDLVASVSQISMIISLSILINTKRKKHISKKLLVGILGSIIMYFGGWILYYQGITNALIVLDMCIAPCISFMLFSIARRNLISLIFLLIFMVCHIIYGVINFILL